MAGRPGARAGSPAPRGHPRRWPVPPLSKPCTQLCDPPRLGSQRAGDSIGAPCQAVGSGGGGEAGGTQKGSQGGWRRGPGFWHLPCPRPATGTPQGSGLARRSPAFCPTGPFTDSQRCPSLAPTTQSYFSPVCSNPSFSLSPCCVNEQRQRQFLPAEDTWHARHRLLTWVRGCSCLPSLLLLQVLRSSLGRGALCSPPFSAPQLQVTLAHFLSQ